MHYPAAVGNIKVSDILWTYGRAGASLHFRPFLHYTNKQMLRFYIQVLCNAYQQLKTCWSSFLEGLLPYAMLMLLRQIRILQNILS